MKTTWKVTVTDTAIYNIKAESKEEAEETGLILAMDWFEQREPHVKIEATEDEAEYEIVDGYIHKNCIDAKEGD